MSMLLFIGVAKLSFSSQNEFEMYNQFINKPKKIDSSFLSCSCLTEHEFFKYVVIPSSSLEHFHMSLCANNIGANR